MLCREASGRDACGGASEQPQSPFDPCGECAGRWACDASSLVCVVAPERRPRTLYRDNDEDGYGDRDDPGQSLCGGTAGFVENADDCDDSRRTVNPGESETPGNDLDDDCNPGTPD